MSSLGDMGGDLGDALEAISVPGYCIDTAGVIRWLNPAAERLVGDVRGKQFTSVVAPEEARRAREHFAKNIAGRERVNDAEVVIIGADGDRLKVEISSVPLTEDHTCVGIFGQIADVEDQEERPHLPELTPRQAEVLRLLERGYSTEQIARELHLSTETVRNHIRRLLQALGVHSRLEAVATARNAA